MNNLAYFIKADTWRNNSYSVSKREAFEALSPYLDRDSLRRLIQFRMQYRALCKEYYYHFDALNLEGGYEHHWIPLQLCKQRMAELIEAANHWWFNRHGVNHSDGMVQKSLFASFLDDNPK